MKTLTIREVRLAAISICPANRLPGCFWINPPLKLECVTAFQSAGSGDIKEGEVFHADEFDESGRNPGTLKLVERGFWWNVEWFKIVQ